MSHGHWMALFGALALGLSGCGKSGGSGGGQASSADAAGEAAEAGPATIVSQFLEAVRTGSDEKASQLLSPLARKKAAENNRCVTPPPSETARFEVGETEYILDDGNILTAASPPPNCTGARVACAWTDLDENGKPRTEHALWVTRREAEGWRVVGVAATIFPGEPPLLLNFEDPEDMQKKQEWLRQQLAQREKQGSPAAQTSKNGEESFRR
jgi:hypothetical protein